MNVGEFEDIYGTFDYSEYPTFIKVSYAIGGTVIFDGISKKNGTYIHTPMSFSVVAFPV